MPHLEDYPVVQLDPKGDSLIMRKKLQLLRVPMKLLTSNSGTEDCLSGNIPSMIPTYITDDKSDSVSDIESISIKTQKDQGNEQTIEQPIKSRNKRNYWYC